MAYSVHSPSLSQSQLSSPSGYERTKLVFDYGGGTLDVSVVTVGYKSNGSPAGVEVIATMGDIALGGDDMTSCLAVHLKKRYGGNGWGLFAEEARVKLSSSSSLSYVVPLSGPEDKALADFEEVEQSSSPSSSSPLPSSTQQIDVSQKDFEKSIEVRVRVAKRRPRKTQFAQSDLQHRFFCT